MFSYVRKYFKKRNLDLAKSSKGELKKFYYLIKVISRHNRLRKEINLVQVEQVQLYLWFYNFNSLIEEISRVKKNIANYNFSRPMELTKKSVSLESFVRSHSGFKLLRDRISNTYTQLVFSSLTLCEEINVNLLTDTELKTFEVTYSYLLQDINEILITMLEKELSK